MTDSMKQQPAPLSSKKDLLSKRSISRRSFVIGLTGLALVEAVAGGNITWKVLLQKEQTFSQQLQTFSLILRGTLLFTYRGHSSSVYSLAWSPDGKRIASASFDNTVQVWEPLTGNHAFTYRGHSDLVYDVAWSPDGKLIA